MELKTNYLELLVPSKQNIIDRGISISPKNVGCGSIHLRAAYSTLPAVWSRTVIFPLTCAAAYTVYSTRLVGPTGGRPILLLCILKGGIIRTQTLSISRHDKSVLRPFSNANYYVPASRRLLAFHAKTELSRKLVKLHFFRKFPHGVAEVVKIYHRNYAYIGCVFKFSPDKPLRFWPKRNYKWNPAGVILTWKIITAGERTCSSGSSRRNTLDWQKLKKKNVSVKLHKTTLARNFNCRITARGNEGERVD